MHVGIFERDALVTLSVRGTSARVLKVQPWSDAMVATTSLAFNISYETIAKVNSGYELQDLVGGLSGLWVEIGLAVLLVSSRQSIVLIGQWPNQSGLSRISYLAREVFPQCTYFPTCIWRRIRPKTVTLTRAPRLVTAALPSPSHTD